MIYKSIYERYVPGIVPPKEENTPTLTFIFVSNKLLVGVDGEEITLPNSTDLEEHDVNYDQRLRLYLGELDGLSCYCALLQEEINLPSGFEFRDLRSLLTNFDEDIFQLAGRAIQIVNWDRMNKYCGRCGTITETKGHERAKHCTSCGSVFYPRISPAIIVAVTKDDKILLAHNKNFRENWYSCVAGFVEPGETFEDCVKREVMEEVGIRVKNIKYFGSQPWPFPDSMMIGFTAEYEGGDILVDGVEIDDAKWFDVQNLPQRPSNISIAGRLIKHYLEANS